VCVCMFVYVCVCLCVFVYVCVCLCVRMLDDSTSHNLTTRASSESP
jgi:hypothetical protein